MEFGSEMQRRQTNDGNKVLLYGTARDKTFPSDKEILHDIQQNAAIRKRDDNKRDDKDAMRD